MPKTEQLEKTRVLQLLTEADTKWFNSHSSKYDYREHLEFTADYVAKNYGRQPKKEKHHGLARRTLLKKGNGACLNLI